MIKKEKEIEAEKLLEEQAETVKPRRGRPRKVEVDKSLENTELSEEKKQKHDEEDSSKKTAFENSNCEEKMIKDILSENVTKLKRMAKEYKIEGFSGMSKLELINAILIKKGEEIWDSIMKNVNGNNQYLINSIFFHKNKKIREI